MRTSEVERVLSLVGVRNLRPSPEGYSCACPYHSDKHASCSVNASKRIFVCHSAKCGQAGPLWIMLRDFLGYSREQAEDVLGATVEVFSYQELSESPEPQFSPAILGVYKRLCPEYLLGRGFQKKTLREWEVGYDAATQTAVIPVRDRGGKLVGLVKRDTTGEALAKYVHLYYSKGDYLFGEHRVDGREMLYVAEGTLSPIKAYQVGLRNVVATSGSRITDKQLSLMAKYPTVTVIMDGDMDGVRATERIVKHLLPRLGERNVQVCSEFSRGVKDLDEEIDSGNLHHLLQTSRSAEDWLFSTSQLGHLSGVRR